MSDWAALQPFFEELQSRDLPDAAALERWLLDRSELEAVLGENLAWRYIHMTCDTQDAHRAEAFQYFVAEIEPHIAPYDDALNTRLLASPFVADLDPDRYRVFLRSARRASEIYRAANVPLKTEISTKQQQYAATVGTMSVTLDGQELTLPQAADRLKNPNRAVRETAWRAIQARRMQNAGALDQLFTELVQLRQQVAVNADFANFRDYMFAALGRFDYTPQDCVDFHAAIRATVVPLIDDLDRQRQQDLALPALRPWDLDVDPSGQPPLRPFATGDELLGKTITVFHNLDPFLGNCLKTMRQMGHLDLESRKGKAPGGYNYPLDETGVPFIFMNATSSLRDVVTMLHEGGHAVHSFLTRSLPLGADKHPPSEVAELASMSMELMSLDQWHVFFPRPRRPAPRQANPPRRGARNLPLGGHHRQISALDIHPPAAHRGPAPCTKWLALVRRVQPAQRELAGPGNHQALPMWQKQLHLYEVPFYYIEYAMAQLGAIAVWRNFRRKTPPRVWPPTKRALALGYTAPIGEIYAAAGIRFDFSTEYLRSLADFVREEMAAL